MILDIFFVLFILTIISYILFMYFSYSANKVFTFTKSNIAVVSGTLFLTFLFLIFFGTIVLVIVKIIR